MEARITEPAPGSTAPAGLVGVRGWINDDLGAPEQGLLLADDGQCVPLRIDEETKRPSWAPRGTMGFRGDLDLRTASGTVRMRIVIRRAGGEWSEVAGAEFQVVPPERDRDGMLQRAAFTLVQNEAVWLPTWLRHYGQWFAPEDLYVLDHGSTDGGTEGLAGRCNVIPVHHEASFDHVWMRNTVERFQAFLLRSYDLVLFAEADEFIVAAPGRYAGLGDYLDRLERPAATCSGFNVVHQRHEPPLRLDDGPLLSRRGWWQPTRMHSKRLISRVPLRWSEGFHREYTQAGDEPDPDLLLIHMHRADFDICLARHRDAAARDWSRLDVARKQAYQHRITGPLRFRWWFRRGSDLAGPRQPIPDEVRALL